MAQRPKAQTTEQGAAPPLIGQTNGVNNEQDSFGGGGFQPIAFDDNDTRPTSRSADDKRLAEVEIDGEINAKSETQRVDIPGGANHRTLASSDADTEPDSGRKTTGGNGDAGAVDTEPEHSASARLSAQNLAKLSTQRRAQDTGVAMVYEKSRFKRSRIRKGWLIKRLTGYSIAETEYGVSYLWVLSRKPDRTSADNSVWPLAGYFNWKSLEASGLLRKEKKTK